MIKIDFSSAISIYVSFSIFLVFALWLFYTLRRNGVLNDVKYLHQCPYCTYIFFKYRSETVSPGSMPATVSKEGEVSASLTKEAAPDSTKTDLLVCPRCQSYIHLAQDDPKGEH